MRTTRGPYLGIVAAGLAVFLAASLARMSAQQPAGGAVRIDNDDIGGVVTSAKGPEAGVWVIAETTDLPTKFVKIVVTDDRGRYLVPDLPKANYRCGCAATGWWIRAKVQAVPGKSLDLDSRGGAERARGRGVLSGQLIGIPC